MKELTTNPQGETDGLLLDDGTEIRFRPEAADKVKAAIAPKDRVTIEGWTHAGESVIHAGTIKNEASGKLLVVDHPPPGITIKGAERSENGPGEEADRRRQPPPEEDAGPGPRTGSGDRLRGLRQGGREGDVKKDLDRQHPTCQSGACRIEAVPSIHAEPGPGLRLREDSRR